MSAEAMILVFQMGKVASMSWYEAIRTGSPDAVVHHFHVASPAARSLIAALRGASGPEQTIARRNFEFLWGLPPEPLVPWLRDGTWSGPPVKIIAGIREPVGRAASYLQYCADFHGHTVLNLTARDRGSPETLVSLFRRAWNEVLGGPPAADTFARFLAFGFGQYRTWFTDELAGVFRLNAMSGQFDRDCGCMTLDNGPHSAFIYRVEDLTDPSMRERVLAAASTFLGKTLGGLSVRNSAQHRRSRELYRDFRTRAAFPDDALRRIYDVPIMHRFYDPDEIAAFKTDWHRVP